MPVYQEVPFFESQIKNGKLPPIAERLPDDPAVASFEWPGQAPGNYGGELTMLMSSAKDTRYLVTYGYAQLVVYDAQYKLVPNILESFEVEDGRIFTFHLRKGQKWSDGSPFTTEDFRFFWEDIANNPELSPAGPPADLIRDGEPAKVEVIDKTTIRYSWSTPNANFLPALALRPDLFIYSPSKYLKKLHKKYADPDELAALVKDAGVAQLGAASSTARTTPTSNDNPKMPTLGPWVLKTKPPADRVRLRAQPLLLPGRSAGPSAALYRQGRLVRRRRQARPGQGGRRRIDAAGQGHQLRRLHLPQGGREERRLPGAALEDRQRLQLHACSPI